MHIKIDINGYPIVFGFDLNQLGKLKAAKRNCLLFSPALFLMTNWSPLSQSVLLLTRFRSMIYPLAVVACVDSVPANVHISPP